MVCVLFLGIHISGELTPTPTCTPPSPSQMLRSCYWEDALNWPSHRSRSFALFIPSVLSLANSSCYSGLSSHITSKRPSLTTLSKIDYLTSKSLSHTLVYFPHSTRFTLRFSYSAHFIVCLPRWNVNHRRAGPFLFTLESPVPRTVPGT